MEKTPMLHSEKNTKAKQLTLHGNTTVLVTSQFQSERLIRAGRVIADISSTNLSVLNIQNSENPSNPEAIQHLFDVSSQNGATMQLLYSDNAYKTICQYIRNSKSSFVISGAPRTADSILHKIWERFRQVHFFIVNEDDKIQEVSFKDYLPKQQEEQ